MASGSIRVRVSSRGEKREGAGEVRERGRVAAAFLTTMSALWRSDTVGHRRAAAADPRGRYWEEEGRPKVDLQV